MCLNLKIKYKSWQEEFLQILSDSYKKGKLKNTSDGRDKDEWSERRGRGTFFIVLRVQP